MYEGVHHGEEHPDVVHLDVGCARQGLGYSDEAETIKMIIVLNFFISIFCVSRP